MAELKLGTSAAHAYALSQPLTNPHGERFH